jgi:Tannase-like family of unknown function (DUF6351)
MRAAMPGTASSTATHRAFGTQAFPLYGTSRIVAGAPIEGAVYDCARKSVDQAVADGTYAPWLPNTADFARLKQIFPEGVCDYIRSDQARPYGYMHDGRRGDDHR